MYILEIEEGIMGVPKKSLAMINGSLAGSFVTVAPIRKAQLYFIRRFDTLMLTRATSVREVAVVRTIKLALTVKGSVRNR